jgi:hypothetical protein
MDGLHINTELKSRAEQDERTDPQKQPEKPPCQATLAGAEEKKGFRAEEKSDRAPHDGIPQEPVPAGVYATGRSSAKIDACGAKTEAGNRTAPEESSVRHHAEDFDSPVTGKSDVCRIISRARC